MLYIYNSNTVRRWHCYLEHFLVGGVFATFTAKVFAHALQLSAKMDHPLDGSLAPPAELPLGLCRLDFCVQGNNVRN